MNSLIQQSLNNITYWEMRQGEVSDTTPITLVLHWMGGSPAAIQSLLGEFSTPMRAIFLQGEYPCDDGFSWYPGDSAFYNRAEAEQAPDIQRMADRIAVFLTQLKSVYPAKVAVTGMSQGGDLTLSLAAFHPELMNLAIPCAGRLSPSMRPTQFSKAKHPLPRVFLKHGVDDPIVPVAFAREASNWLRSVGYNADLQEYPNTPHELSQAMVGDIQRILATLHGN